MHARLHAWTSLGRMAPQVAKIIATGPITHWRSASAESSELRRPPPSIRAGPSSASACHRLAQPGVLDARAAQRRRAIRFVRPSRSCGAGRQEPQLRSTCGTDLRCCRAGRGAGGSGGAGGGRGRPGGGSSGGQSWWWGGLAALGGQLMMATGASAASKKKEEELTVDKVVDAAWQVAGPVRPYAVGHAACSTPQGGDRSCGGRRGVTSRMQVLTNLGFSGCVGVATGMVRLLCSCVLGGDAR